MKQTINFSQFRDAFNRMDRGSQFSYEALELIYNHLEECDPDFELDVIAICCEFSEGLPIQIAKDYGFDIEEDGNELNNVLDCLYDETIVLGTASDNIVFVQF